MMQEERYGTRDRSYSAWHRRLSIGRYVGIERAQLLAMIDLDASLYVEYDDGTKEPLALIETARDVGQHWKSATVTLQLATRADLPCYVVLYELGALANPADSSALDILSFRVRRLYPSPISTWRKFTPQEWAENLEKLRKREAAKIDEWLFAKGGA